MSTTQPATWRQLLAEATDILGSPDEARRIVEDASGLSAAELLLALDDAVPARAGVRLSTMVERRALGEPLQYVLGRWSFRTLDLMVDRRVLIPRPETEVVAGVAIDEARRITTLAEPVRDRTNLVAVDLGTGSGAIALSLAVELSGAEVWATDVSSDALDVASANLCGIGGAAATRVQLARGSWFEALPDSLRGRVDVLVSNPPYIADDERLPDDVDRWEPSGALRAGPTGVECLSAIVAQATSWLADPGTLVLEIAPHQRSDVTQSAALAGFAADHVEVHQDLAGRDRVLVARR